MSAPRDSLAVSALRIVRTVVLDVGAVLGALSIVVTLVCLAAGLQPAVVVSGSMEPSIPVGALTLSREKDAREIQVGDVVTVPRTDTTGLITHRVVATEPTATGAALTLQGDANRTADARPYDVSTVRAVVLDVPFLGYVALWVQTNLTTVVVLLVAATVLVVVAGRLDRPGGEVPPGGVTEPPPQAAAQA